MINSTTTEVKGMAIGVTNEGRVRLQMSEVAWTDMPPEIARWIASELIAAADRIEAGARIEAAKKVKP